ncbi:hypothetical protein EMCRGX_G021920 [Ephydatia muelleri]
MRFWRTGACVLHYKAAEDDEEFDETSLRLKEGEYALSKDITVCLWLEYRSLNGSTPLRDVSGGDFVIVNEELHGEFDEFRSKVYAYVDKEYSIVEAVELLQVWCRAMRFHKRTRPTSDIPRGGRFISELHDGGASRSIGTVLKSDMMTPDTCSLYHLDDC